MDILSQELGYTFVANPLVLALSIAGPARVSKAPLGPRLVRLFFGRNPFAIREVPRQARLEAVNAQLLHVLSTLGWTLGWV